MTSLSVEQQKNICQPIECHGGAQLGVSKPLAAGHKRPVTNSGACQVKLCVDLNIKAIKTHQGKLLALWYCLRALDINGTGHLPLDQAIEALEDIFEYKHNTLFEHLKQGEGLFWTRVVGKYRARIDIKALQKVFAYLGITRIEDKHWRILTPAQFNTTRMRSAQLYATIFKPDGIRGNPQSRQTITERTGLHKMQQRRFEKEAKVKRTPNYAMATIRDDNGKLESRKLIIHTVYGKSRSYQVPKRQGNIYHNKALPGARGMLKKASITLRDRGFSVSGEAAILKRYFSSFKQFSKALQRTTGGLIREGYILLPNKQRLIPGRLEWQYVEA